MYIFINILLKVKRIKGSWFKQVIKVHQNLGPLIRLANDSTELTEWNDYTVFFRVNFLNLAALWIKHSWI